MHMEFLAGDGELLPGLGFFIMDECLGVCLNSTYEQSKVDVDFSFRTNFHVSLEMA